MAVNIKSHRSLFSLIPGLSSPDEKYMQPLNKSRFVPVVSSTRGPSFECMERPFFWWLNGKQKDLTFFSKLVSSLVALNLSVAAAYICRLHSIPCSAADRSDFESKYCNLDRSF